MTTKKQGKYFSRFIPLESNLLHSLSESLNSIGQAFTLDCQLIYSLRLLQKIKTEKLLKTGVYFQTVQMALCH